MQIQENWPQCYISLKKFFTFNKHLLTGLLKNLLSSKHCICSIYNFEAWKFSLLKMGGQD
jgi:hypothetical protein